MIDETPVGATRSRVRTWLFGCAAIVLLMWPALVNRQPFYFSDTTSYVRTADLVAHIVAGPAAATIWTRPEFDSPRPAAAPAVPPVPRPDAPVAARGNDLAAGYIMAGRSPYFGILLWVAWVVSCFWLFVIAQAVLAWLLIGLALRCFGLDRPRTRLGVAAILAVVSPLALYNGLLLADALSGFGVAALLILAAPHVRLARWERVLLICILLVSAMAHLTHIAMLIGMTALLGMFVVARLLPWRRARAPIVIGAFCAAIGLLSVAVTGWVVEARFGKPPVLVPLITARFIADGPGRTFIEDGCDNRRFTICHLPYRGWTNSTEFLWSRDPARGAFLMADPATRTAMSHEDKAFAFAVLAHSPLRTIGHMAWNTILQITDLRVDILDERFIRPAGMGAQFPPSLARDIAGSPAGRGAWPLPLLNGIVYCGAILSLATLIVLLPRLYSRDVEAARLLALWVALIACAMLLNGFLGGAISEPQSRYQTRMAWLIPLCALIALLAARRARNRVAAG